MGGYYDEHMILHGQWASGGVGELYISVAIYQLPGCCIAIV